MKKTIVINNEVDDALRQRCEAERRTMAKMIMEIKAKKDKKNQDTHFTSGHRNLHSATQSVTDDEMW